MTALLPAAMWLVGIGLLVRPGPRSSHGFALGAAMAIVGCYWTVWA